MKKEIIEIAHQILEDVGFDHISMRNIATELEVSATALYRHFANKEAIVNALVKIGFERLMKTLTTSLNEHNAEKRLKACLLAYIFFGLHQIELYALMFQLNHLSTEPNRIKNKNYRQPVNRFMQDRVRDVLKANKNRQVNPVEFSGRVWCFMHGTILLYVNQQIDLSPEEFDRHVHQVLDGWMEQLK